MRKEAEIWLRQGEEDLKTAREMKKVRIYYMTAFLCHQASEKVLKALIIEKKRHLPPKTHNLIELGKVASVPKKVLSGLRLLNPEYVTSRYPDAANGIPAENYDQAKTEPLLQAAERVMRWVTSELTKIG